MLKRAFDLIVGSALLVLSAPLLLAVAAAVRWRLGRPVLFRQVRAGRGGRPFALLKFRTMRSAHDAAGLPLPDAERLTRFGQWLRATSLDELPELLHVVRGEMSLVGPRPLPVAYLPRYTPRQARRHEVRPGLTGWAQVHGRNDCPWPERLERDVWYVEHQSFWLDLRILLRTVGLVLGGRGVQQAGHATAEEFHGGG